MAATDASRGGGGGHGVAGRLRLSLPGVTVLARDAKTSDVPGSLLVLDAFGVGLQLPGMVEPRVLPWAKVTRWNADSWSANTGSGAESNRSGARLTFSTGKADYGIGVPGADVERLRWEVAAIVAEFTIEPASTESLAPPAASVSVPTATVSSAANLTGAPQSNTAAATPPPSTSRRARHAASRTRTTPSLLVDFDWTRYKPFLAVIGLIVVLGAAGLVLAQSAGWVHISILGGNGSGTPGAILNARGTLVLRGH